MKEGIIDWITYQHQLTMLILVGLNGKDLSPHLAECGDTD